VGAHPQAGTTVVIRSAFSINHSGEASKTAQSGGVIAALWVLLLFSNLPAYVASFLLPALPLTYTIAVLLVFSVLLVTSGTRSRPGYSRSFLGVLAGYSCLCLLWYVAQGGGDVAILRERILGLTACACAYAVFSHTPKALGAARRTLVVVVLMSVALNFWDFSHPFAFVPIDSEFASVGRAAGLFINPNQAGAALVLGFALSISVVTPRWRVAYTVAVAAGVLLTLSRGAMLGFVFVCLGLAIWSKVLTGRALLATAFSLAFVGYLGWLVVSDELQSRLNVRPEFVLDRLLWLLDPEGRADYSQEERLQLLERGWNQFLTHPLLGNGLGSTELWDLRSSTHNLYAMLGSDFGIVGLFVLPLVIFSASGWPWKSDKGAVIAGLFVIFWGLFSHNVLGEFYFLVGIAMIAARDADLAKPLPQPDA
jgi:hypothetical protein